jgi:hypothetical protein
LREPRAPIVAAHFGSASASGSWIRSGTFCTRSRSKSRTAS